MAVLQRFRKVRETGQEVEYTFGYPEMTRQLTISKADRTYSVTDGQEDHASRAVVRTILRRWTDEQTWPPGGGTQA